jgi:hypothetical protein
MAITADDFKRINLQGRSTPDTNRIWGQAVKEYGPKYLEQNMDRLLPLLSNRGRMGTQKLVGLQQNFSKYVKGVLAKGPAATIGSGKVAGRRGRVKAVPSPSAETTAVH